MTVCCNYKAPDPWSPSPLGTHVVLYSVYIHVHDGELNTVLWERARFIFEEKSRHSKLSNCPWLINSNKSVVTEICLLLPIVTLMQQVCVDRGVRFFLWNAQRGSSHYYLAWHNAKHYIMWDNTAFTCKGAFLVS